MSRFGNRAIAASAGTGKTWALAHRYLALMTAAQADPDRICALTFSRKAAGEILEKIVERLCAAASQADERMRVAAAIEQQAAGVRAPVEAADYLRLLRTLLNRAHRLRIGTLDSFLLGIVRAFPMELGLPPEIRPMDNAGGEACAQRAALLTRLYDPSVRNARAGGEDAAAALLEAFRQATYGREGKSLSSRLDALVAERYDFFCQHAARQWGGRAGGIWPPPARWWEAADAEAARRLAEEPAFQEELTNAFGGATRAQQLGAACAFVARTGAAHTGEKVWPEWSSHALFDQLLAAAPDRSPPALRYYGKPYDLPAPLWPPLRAALAHLVAVEVGRALQQTAGLGSMLTRYDALYRETQRMDGGFTFSDLSRLLADPAHQASRNAGAADKLYVDYRLDGQLDHWLLDEFQDTGDDQWQAIANLIDEVVQDESRSFFYVGDIKQSIYGWRGGNWRLFDRVRQDCGLGPAETLVTCHRSLPAIIQTINSVFRDLKAWQPAAGAEKGPHAEAVAAFVGPAWPEHKPAPGAPGQGFVALVEYQTGARTASAGDEAGGDDEARGDEAAYEAVADILAEVQPTVRRLDAAVLVRSNEQGRACADVLRRRLPGVAVVHEGTGGIVDHPVVTLLLALARYAAHPADTLARQHLAMSPLASDDGWLEALPLAFAAALQEAGFAGALRPWGEMLVARGALQEADGFGRQRLREFLAAAEAFDATGLRDADRFAEHIQAYQVRSPAATGAIRIMTIHQSKGLGFDVVLVPFDARARSFANLQGVRLLRSDRGADATAPAGWVLQAPVRDVLQAADGALTEAFDAARAEANFEQLCVLYVALTRAKRALYLLVPPAAKSSTSVREADLLREQLVQGGTATTALHGHPLLYAAGDPDWCSQTGTTAPPVDETPGGPAPLAIACVPGVPLCEPSKDDMEGRLVPAAWLFSEEAGDVPAFGLALHRLFERIEWVDEAEIEELVCAWRAESTESAAVLRDVEAQFRRCLASAEARACLERPGGASRSVVWREAPFSLVREGQAGPEILSGRFDRLVVEQDASGRPLRATVVDFKSNRVDSEEALAEKAAGYAGQMRDYAMAAGRLLGLQAGQVATMLLWTRVGRAVAV